MKNARGEIVYVGKAGNLKKRVSSYFLRPQDGRISKLVSEIAKIDYKKTDTVLEALILEAELIKKYSPKYNIKEKDDKSFLYVEITKDEFARVVLTRGKDLKSGFAARYGPFVSASSAREALSILRKIFPYSVHKQGNKKLSKGASLARPCFDYELGLCPGTCAGLTGKKEYLRNIKNLKMFFRGKKKEVLKSLKKEMKQASDSEEFEKAERLRRQIFALCHIQDTALIKDENFRFPFAMAENFQKTRIEGYDISNISGTSAVGSMVVFARDAPLKDEYRKFKIKTVLKSGDVAMLREVLTRRFSRHKNDWPLPDLVLVDGGEGQVNIAKTVLKEQGLKIPIIGIAKGLERKKNKFHGAIPKWTNKDILIQVRDEAHRFAILYHKKVRGREFIK